MPASVAAADFVGSSACRACHPNQHKVQSSSHHARALRAINETPFSDLLTKAPLRERNGMAFEYRKVDGGVEVTVSKDQASTTMLLEWAFGAGSKGFTPVGRNASGFVEHRVSWYALGNKLALTAGHPQAHPVDLKEALGIAQTEENASRCFNCHATGVTNGPDLSRMTPGVTCERCHGPASDHVAAARKGVVSGIIKSRNVALCAQCHRSPDARFQSKMPELDDPASIRFAPVGFTVSDCYSKSKGFTCVSCHNPHEDPKPATDASYTAVCRSCHASPPRSCRTNGACVSCHMRQSSPLPNLVFTDHRIRVYP